MSDVEQTIKILSESLVYLKRRHFRLKHNPKYLKDSIELLNKIKEIENHINNLKGIRE